MDGLHEAARLNYNKLSPAVIATAGRGLPSGWAGLFPCYQVNRRSVSLRSRSTHASKSFRDTRHYDRLS